MQFNFNDLDTTSRYKLLTGIVVPRPIAWITTLNENKTVNAAPFSFFNVVGSDPGLVVMGIGNHPDRPKDTATNIARNREFVVNLVAEHHAQQMSDTATDFPKDISEVDQVGLLLTPSARIETPRIQNVPAALECIWERTLDIGSNRVIFGEVVSVYVDDSCIQDAARCYVDTEKMHLIGRMGGTGGYTKTNETFQIARKSFAKNT